MNSASSAPAQKVVAASAGGGLGGAVAVVVLYLLAQYAHFDPPAFVTAALTLLITAACSFAAGYVTPPAERDVIAPAAPKGTP